MRGYSQGGRFDADFESDSIDHGINHDLQRFSGTNAEWWVFDPDNTGMDSVYDVASYDGVGRRWRGPYDLPVVRAIIQQGAVQLNERGFYSADMLHLTLNSEDIEKIAPGVVGNPDLQSRGRIVWLNEVFRPFKVQQAGIVANRFSLVTVECIQVMHDELVNDPQFSKYAGPYDGPASYIKTTLPPNYGYGSGEYGDTTSPLNGYGA